MLYLWASVDRHKIHGHRTRITHSVSTRTISLADDAYEALLAMKQPGESFSDVVRRITRRRSLTELSGIMDPDAAASVGEAIEANRCERLATRREEARLE